MFRKADRLNAESLRLTKIALGVALVTSMLYAASSNTLARCVDSYPLCPTISISCPANQVTAGAPATVSVKLSGGDTNKPVTYNWTISSGTITSGQGTSTITIDTTGLNDVVTATVEIIGLPSECDRTKSCSFPVAGIITGDDMKFDEYSDLKFSEEKPRLDNVAIQLQQMPGAQALYFIFGSCEGEADQRAQRAVDYLVNKRGIDRSRLKVVNSGCRETLTVEVWITPIDVPYPPTPGNAATVEPCPKCKAKPKVRRGARRRGRRQ